MRTGNPDPPRPVVRDSLVSSFNMPQNLEHHTFSAKLDCRYLLSIPPQVDHATVLVLTLHGYSSNPDDMLRLTAGMMGDRHILASLHHRATVDGARFHRVIFCSP